MLRAAIVVPLVLVLVSLLIVLLWPTPASAQVPFDQMSNRQWIDTITQTFPTTCLATVTFGKLIWGIRYGGLPEEGYPADVGGFYKLCADHLEADTDNPPTLFQVQQYALKQAALFKDDPDLGMVPPWAWREAVP
jgi:hypothetical protein